MNLYDYVVSIPDFPSKGIIFRDVTPVFNHPDALAAAIDGIAEAVKDLDFDLIAGPEARGFILGAALAYKLHKGFIPVRKPGKLPRETVSASYDLEYGSNELHMHTDSLANGKKVLIVDDLLATGGTVEACIELVEKLGGEAVGAAFIIELVDLKGREALSKIPVHSLITFEGE